MTVTPSPMLRRLLAAPGSRTRLQPDRGRATPSRPCLVWGRGLQATTRDQAVRLRRRLGMLPAAPRPAPMAVPADLRSRIVHGLALALVAAYQRRHSIPEAATPIMEPQ